MHRIVFCADAKYLKWIGCSTSDHYGKDCNQACPDHCNNNRCHIDTGNCFDCKDGYQGQKCEHRM